MENLKLYNLFLEQSTLDDKSYINKIKKEYDILLSKNRAELENPSPYWFNSPTYKRIQELKKIIDSYKEKKIENNQSFLKNMRNTVGDNSASYPEAEKTKNTDMWLNMWARDFILEFIKNEISKVVPTGNKGYCKLDYIHTYNLDSEREFNGKKTLYQELLNLRTPKIHVCIPQIDLSKFKWDHKFKTEKGQISWYQLLNLDWGISNKEKLYSLWNESRNIIKQNEGQFCNYSDKLGEICTEAVYHDPLEWFKDPHNLLTFFEISTAFIPLIGPFLSAGFGLANAKLYWDEGKKEDAILSTFFSILPGLGAIGGKIATKIGQKGLETLSEKIIKQGLRDEVLKGIRNPKWFSENIDKIQKNLTPKEVTLLKDIINNRKYLEKITGDMVRNNPNKFKKLLNDTKSVKTYLEKTAKSSDELTKLKGLSSKVDVGVNIGGLPLGFSAFPLYRKLNPGIREKIEKKGWNFEKIKSEFFSSGNKEDNLKLFNALNSGWTPGQEVPEKFQTNLYKAKKKDIFQNINTDIIKNNYITLSQEESDLLDSLYNNEVENYNKNIRL